MDRSRFIARVLGPVLFVVAVTEAKNLDVFHAVPPAHVFLNGMMLFAAGLGLIVAHGGWTRDWRSLVTLCGWALLLAGLFRLWAPAAPQAGPGPATYGGLALLGLLGAVIGLCGWLAPRRGWGS
ncbi:hypothetical protein [Phenylobacterium sp.]|uniref:hypothetical protein n=1 Tax=Phenylobacterium sp. TaxID=1871053 RepID=UPI0035B35C70